MGIEFNLKGYRELMMHLKSHYEFYQFAYSLKGESRPFIILRHDVDYCPEKALEIAWIEAEELGISATYFILHSSPHYTILDPEVIKIVREIHGLGHAIGFHYDCALFGLADSPIELLREMLGMFEGLCQVKASCISCHNPDVTEEDYFLGNPTCLNANDIAFKGDMPYISDSLGVWRKGFLEKLMSLSMPRVQLLLHPCIWANEKLFNREEFLQDMRAKKIDDVEQYIDWQRGSWNLYLERNGLKVSGGELR